MKIINKYIVLLVVATFFAACSADDDVAVAPASTNMQVVVDPFVSSAVQFVGQVGTNTANVELGFKLKEFSNTYFGSDITIIFDGNEYVIPAGETEVVVGVSNIEFEIDAPAGDLPYNGLTLTTEISIDSQYEIEVANRPGDLVVLKGGKLEVGVTLYSDVPEVSEDNIELVFMNEDEQAGIWFGLSQFTTSGGWITDYNQNSNGTYPRKMSIPLDGNGNLAPIPNSVDVAPNVLGLDLFTQTSISPNMGYTILIMHPNGILEVFDGNITSGAFVDNAVIAVDVTDDMDNPGMKKYVFSTF